MILDEHWSPFSELAYQRKCVQFLRVFRWLYPLPVFTLASFHLLSLPSSNCQAVWLTHLRDFINLNPRKLLIMHGLDGNASSTMCIISTLLLSQPTMPSPLCLHTNHQTPTNSQSYLSAHSTDSPYQFHAIDSTISTYISGLDRPLDLTGNRPLMTLPNFRLPSRSRWEPHSSGLLRGEWW